LQVTDPVKPGKKKKKADEKTDGEETDKGGKKSEKSEKEGSKDKEKAAADDKKKKRKIRLDMHLDQVKAEQKRKNSQINYPWTQSTGRCRQVVVIWR
jgi:hypothetical protein